MIIMIIIALISKIRRYVINKNNLKLFVNFYRNENHNNYNDENVNMKLLIDIITLSKYEIILNSLN